MRVRIFRVGYVSPDDYVDRVYPMIPAPGMHIMGPLLGASVEPLVVRRTVLEHDGDVDATLFVDNDRPLR